MAFDPTTVTVQDFKNYFDRHFQYAPSTAPNDPQYIRDIDITNAFQQARINFNSRVFGEDDESKLAFLFLAAHYLCMDMRMAQSGLASVGQYIVASKSVGDVSASYAIPSTYTSSPLLSYLTTTDFGLKYISLLYPRTIGSYNVVRGTTTPR